MTDNLESFKLVENPDKFDDVGEEYNDTNYSSSGESENGDEEEMSDLEKTTLNKNNDLKERLASLKGVMATLKNQLEEERSKWKEEVEETEKLIANHQVTTPTVEVKNDCYTEVHETKSSDATDYATIEYENQLSTYQNAIINAQAEKRAHLRRQLAINNYKRRLMEVENMCNLELLRVKQSVQYLQPLQMMASEWKTGNVRLDEEITGLPANKAKLSGDVKEKDTHFLENLSNKLNGEFSDIFAKLNSSNLGLSQLTSSSSSLWLDEDIGTTHSEIWYPADNFSSCYNPLM